MAVCRGADLTTLSDACVRGFWAAILPTAFVGLLLVASVPPARTLLRFVNKTLANFLPLHEAEVLIAGEEEKHAEEEIAPGVPLWRTLVLSTVSLIETLLWLSIGCYSLIVNPHDTWNGVRDFLVAVTWLYASLRPVVRPAATAPLDLLSLYSMHLILNSVVFFGHLYDRYVYDMPMPTTLRTVVYGINLVAVAGLLLLVFSMPLAIPSKRVKKEDIVRALLSLYSCCSWVSCCL